MYTVLRFASSLVDFDVVDVKLHRHFLLLAAKILSSEPVSVDLALSLKCEQGQIMCHDFRNVALDLNGN